MTKFTLTLLSAAATAALMAPAASAQESYDKKNGDFYVDQLQLDDVWSNIDVYVDEASKDIGTSSVSAGNAATAIIHSGDINYKAKQVNDGNVDTRTDIWAGWVEGDVVASSAATGNSSYAGNWYGDAHVDVEQSQLGDVTATSRVDVRNAWAVSGQTTAVANVSSVESDYGHFVESSQRQFTDGSVHANSRVSAGNVGIAQNVAIAAGNSADTAIDDVPDAWVLASQVNEGKEVTSYARTRVRSAYDVVTASNAAGNQLNVSAIDSNTYVGATGSEAFQGNEADVYAATDTRVRFLDGAATASANGVGNSLHASSLGGNTGVNAVQSNSGNVGTTVSLETIEFSGGIGIASANSIGNSYSAATVDGNLNGSVIQTNRGNISAQSSIRSSQIGSGAATATAIGNSAVFETRANNNGRRD